MSLLGQGSEGGSLPAVEYNDPGDRSLIPTSFPDNLSFTSTISSETTITTMSTDSELEESRNFFTSLTIETKKRTHRGGRRNKVRDPNDMSSTRYTFIFEKNPWGDCIQCSDDWPKNMDRLRIVSCNLGGVSYYNNIKEWEIILGHLVDLQADVFCLSELNLNLYHPFVRDKLFEYKHSIDKHIKLKYSCSKPLDKNSQYQMGGTITGVSGRWSGRDLNDELQYPVESRGRWTLSHLKGKKNIIITVVTIYRVCQQSHTGKNTIWIQQQRDHQAATGRLVNPCQQFIEDVSKLVIYLHSKSHHVILCGDVNEDMNIKSTSNKWREMLRLCNMYVVSDVKFPNAILPATYERGQKCLDMIALSSTIPIEAVKAMGYLPFCDPIPSDHRAVYVDLDAELLFGTHLPDLTKSTFHHFSVKNMKQTNKYLDEVRRHFTNNKILEKVEKLYTRILLSEECDFPHLILECKKLEKKARQLMMAAEKSLYRGKYQRCHWSSQKLTAAACKYIILKKQRRYMRDSTDYNNSDLEALEDEIALAYIQLKECQKNARTLRDADLEYNANEMAGEWKVTPEQAKKVLLHAEKSQKMFSKIKAAVKDNRISGLKSILIPKDGEEIVPTKDDDNDPTTRWESIIDPEQVFELTLQRNAENLMRSCKAVSATGVISDNMGFFNENEEFCDSLLNGSIDASYLSTQYPDLQKELEQFLKACRKADVQDMDWKFGADEYKSLFKKTRENTACGPSGLHMAHWKAAVMDDNLSKINAFFMWAPFYLGFVYDRWLVSWHCMLLKKQQPYINKLRIIQLFEGDFNGMLKYLLGRKLMRHMVTTNQIDNTTFGSIPGHDSKEAMKLLDMVYMNHRLFSRAMITVFNDAAGCYDRIRPNMADLAMRRVGCPPSVTKAHTTAQLGMVHRVKTSLGISKGSIKWAPHVLRSISILGVIHFLGNIGGIGQGGGGSPVGWLVVLLIMIKAFRHFSPGAKIIDPYNDHNSFQLPVVSYVDDNSLLRSLPEDMPLNLMFETISRDIKSWWNLLKITGGDLAIDKCTFSLMKWKWEGLYNERSLILTSEQDGNVSIETQDNEHIHLRRIQPTTAERQLGFRLTMDGNWDEEFKYRKKQTSSLVKKISFSQLTHFESTMAYQFYIKSTLYYALPVVVFSVKQCEELNKIILNTILPKTGLNRHTPRALVYAPLECGGLGYDHVWTRQLILQIEMFQKHLRRQDALGVSMLCNINCLQVIVGKSTPFWSLDPTKHQYVEQTGCIGMLWQSFYTLEIRCTIPLMSVPCVRHERDEIIMDVATADPLVCCNVRKMVAINVCRMFHGLTSLSDMSQYTGTKMNLGYLSPASGRRIPKKCRHKWPVLPTPTPWQWGVWKEFIFRHFLTGSLVSPSFPPGMSFTTRTTTNTNNDLKDFLQSRYASFHQGLDSFPSSLRLYVGDVHYRNDNIQELCQAFSKGSLQCSTDGSAHEVNEDGSFAYVLMSSESSQQLIYGGGKLPQHPHLTSQRTEHYAVIGILCTLLILQSCTSNTPSTPIVIWIDNDQTKNRVNTTPTPTDSASQFITADYDLWQMILLIKRLLGFEVTANWVKAHQDRDQPIAILPPESKMNILADSIASTIYNMSAQLPRREPHDKDGMFLTHGGRQILDVPKSIPYIIHEPEFCIYICKKRKWTMDMYLSVNWKAIHSALNKFKGESRQNIIQLMHNWQNTGKQKKQFFDSATRNEDDIIRDASLKYSKRHFECPVCHIPVEQQFHFVLCPTAIRTLEIRELRNGLKDKLRKLNTCDSIIDLLHYLLCGKDIRFYSPISMPNIDEQFKVAMNHQRSIGWISFLQGFWHKTWMEVQRIHLTNLKATERVDIWQSSVITALLNYVYDCWKYRNDMLHSTDNSDERRRILLDRVRRLYLDPDRFLFSTREKRRLFNVTLDRRLKHSNATLESWVDLVETRLRLDREEHSRRTLVRWLEKNDT